MEKEVQIKVIVFNVQLNTKCAVLSKKYVQFKK